jgi:hypothetical protein
MIEEIISSFLIILSDTAQLEQETVKTVGQIIGEELSSKEFWIRSLLTGIAAGFVASGIWFAFLQIFKPRIKISPIICRHLHKYEDEQKPRIVYVIKIINKTWWNIVNVNFDAFLMTEYYHGKAKNYNLTSLEIRSKGLRFLYGVHKRDKLTHNNCMQIGIISKVKEMWDDSKSQYLHFQVTANHSFSGRIRTIIHKYYYPKDCIKENYTFKSGQNFEIMQCDDKIAN